MAHPPQHARATVRLHRPVVRRGRVDFRWDQDVRSWLQRSQRWFVDYRGVPLSRLGRRPLYEVLLSMQLPLWSALADEVTVVLPEPVGRVTLDFWCAYHEVTNVRFEGPVDDVRRYEVPPPRTWWGLRPPPRRRPVAVTFGGGKDSTLAWQALLRRRPQEDVLLLHVVQPMTPGREALDATRRRSRSTVLGRDLLRSAPVQVVETDFMALLRRDRPGPRPHVNLYAPAMLPVLAHHGVSDVVFSRTAMGYRVRPDHEGRARFSNPSGRRERLLRLQAYLRDVVGIDIGCESSHAAIGEYVSFGAVVRLFPDQVPRLVMCTRAEGPERFCHACPKCLEYALLSLAEGVPTPDLQLDRLLAHPRVERIAALARERRGTLNGFGVSRYHPWLGTATHFATWCHALHRVDPDDPALPAGQHAREVLRVLREAWGTRAFPAVASIDPAAVEAAGPLGREVAAVAAEAFPVRSPQERPDAERVLLVGNVRARFDHAARMPQPELDDWARRWSVPDWPDQPDQPDQPDWPDRWD